MSDWALAAVIALVVALAAYAPTIGYPYVQDAVQAVRDNPVVARADVMEILSSRYWKGAPLRPDTLYRPATVGSFAVERAVAGRPVPGLSHAVNLFLHALVAWLLGVYARRCGLSRGAALSAAALFAAHPLTLQAVANVVGRSDLLAAAGTLAALLALSWAGDWPDRPVPSSAALRRGSWLAAAALLVALGAKEIAVATPFLLLAQEAYFRPASWTGAGRGALSRVAVLAPSGLALFVWLVLRTLALEGFPATQQPLPLNNPLVGLAAGPRLAGALAMAAGYLRRIVWPGGLAADHSGPALDLPSSPLAPRALAGGAWLVLLLLLVLSPLFARRLPRVRAAAMGAALFLLPYLVVGNLLVLSGAGFAERLVYLPIAGVVLAAAAAGDALAARLAAGRRRRPSLAVVALVAGLVLAGVAATRVQSRQWSGETALWDRVLEVVPGSVRGNFTMAEMRAREGRLAEAVVLYDRALASDPAHAPSWLYRGQALARMGDLASARESLERAVRIDPASFEAHLNLGMVLSREGREQEARRSLGKALRIRPRLLPALAELAHLELRGGDPAAAAALYRQCVERGRHDLRPLLERAEAEAARQGAER